MKGVYPFGHFLTLFKNIAVWAPKLPVWALNLSVWAPYKTIFGKSGGKELYMRMQHLSPSTLSAFNQFPIKR